MLIDTLGIDPKSLKIWTIIYSWGELYEPWELFGGPGEGEAGFTGADVDRIVDYFNSENEIQLTVAFKYPSGDAGLDTETPLDEDASYDISDAIEKADFETAQ